MIDYLQLLLDWSEIWALLIPISILIIKGKQPAGLKPVVIYIWLALLLNIIIDIIMALNATREPGNQLTNNPIYNMHSLVRFACFAVYFNRQPQQYFPAVRKIIIFMMVAFVLVNFIFFENFFEFRHLSGNLLSAEAFFLLMYCMQFYLSQLRNENESITINAHFWVVTGLSIYLVVNFFVFLFYVPLLNLDDGTTSTNMWNVHNIAFIIFCIFTAKAFYGSSRHQHTN